MTTYRKGWPAIHNHYIPSVARRIQATITTAEQNIETLIKTETNDYETIENIHESIRQIDPQHLPIILNMLLIYKYTDTLNVVQKQRLQSLIQYVRGKQNAAIEKQANAILTQKINGIINTAVKSTLDTLKNNISKFIMSDIKNATQRITRLIQSSKCLITQGSSYVNLMTSIMETINGLTVPPLVQTQQENIQLQSAVIEKMFSQTRALTNMQKNAILDLIARNCLTQPTTPENVKLQTVVVNQIISEIDDLETVQRNAILDLIARNCLTQPATPENVKLQTVVVNQIISRMDDLETVQRNEILDFIITNFLAHPTTLKNVELQPSIVTEILSQAPSLDPEQHTNVLCTIVENAIKQPTTPKAVQLQELVINTILSQIQNLTQGQQMKVLYALVQTFLVQPMTSQNATLQTTIVDKILSEVIKLEPEQQTNVLCDIIKDYIKQPSAPEEIQLQSLTIDTILSRVANLASKAKILCILCTAIEDFIKQPIESRNATLQTFNTFIATTILSNIKTLALEQQVHVLNTLTQYASETNSSSLKEQLQLFHSIETEVQLPSEEIDQVPPLTSDNEQNNDFRLKTLVDYQEVQHTPNRLYEPMHLSLDGLASLPSTMFICSPAQLYETQPYVTQPYVTKRHNTFESAPSSKRICQFSVNEASFNTLDFTQLPPPNMNLQDNTDRDFTQLPPPNMNVQDNIDILSPPIQHTNVNLPIAMQQSHTDFDIYDTQ